MDTTAAAEAQYATARTSVWWDIENCQVPNGWDAIGIAQNISSALAKVNYSGPVSISAYGDTNRIPSSVQQALSSTGVALNHVPSGVKDASDKKILVDMLFWAVDNPAPANFMLISGDRDFSNALHQLRMRRYNILLAQPQKASAPLVAAAKTVWLWTSLVAGGGPLTGRESSGPVGDGRFSSDSHEASNHSASERVPTNQPMGLDSEDRRTGDSENRGDYIPKASNQPVHSEDRRTGDSDSVRVCPLCNVVCYSLESFTAHLSGKRHAAQAASVFSGGAGPSIGSAKAQVGVSTNPVKKPNLVKPVWCNICQISCGSKILYTNHTFGKKHQMNLELKLGKSKDTFSGPSEHPKEDMDKKKMEKKVSENGAEAGRVRVCGLCSVVCQSQAVYESHMRGRKHAAMVNKQAEELSGGKKFQEESDREKHQPREAIKEFQFHSRVVQGDMNCFEKQTTELSGRCASSEWKAKEYCQSVEERVGSQNELPPSAESFFTGPSCEFPAHKGAGNASAGAAECLEEEVEKKKKKLIEGGAEADAIKVCDLCKVVCDNQIVFDSHLKGRRHAANVEKQGEEQAVFDAKEILEELVQEKDQPSEVIEKVWLQCLEELENLKCLEAQSKEPTERCATEICGGIEEPVESEDKGVPKAECIVTDINRETRECIDASMKKLELPRDVKMVEKLEEELASKVPRDPNSVCRIS